jgi:hypothetical protein
MAMDWEEFGILSPNNYRKRFVYWRSAVSLTFLSAIFFKMKILKKIPVEEVPGLPF